MAPITEQAGYAKTLLPSNPLAAVLFQFKELDRKGWEEGSRT